jgi:CBS domain-containing protein
MVGRAALLDSEPTAKVGELVDDVVSVAPDDTAMVVLQRIVDAAVDHVPVLDGGRVVGICTRTDLLRARHAVAEADVSQEGWLARRRHRADAALGRTPPP